MLLARVARREVAGEEYCSDGNTYALHSASLLFFYSLVDVFFKGIHERSSTAKRKVTKESAALYPIAPRDKGLAARC
jgi:hypothetical protein